MALVLNATDRRFGTIRHPEHYVSRRIALVLGGGGLKGFAHIGVLRALEELGIVPDIFAGTSIGAMAAASYLSGMSADDLGTLALGMRRRDLFRVNHFGMLLERMRSPSIYLEEPLRALVNSAIPEGTLRRAAQAAARQHRGPGPRRTRRVGASRARARQRARRRVCVVRAAGLLPAWPRGRPHLHRRRRRGQSFPCPSRHASPT